MREIKFRGKSLETNKWIYGYLIKSIDDRYFIGDKLYVNKVINTAIQTFNAVEVDPETVGQFTGLHDKNDKEIYEGDIVKTRYGKGMVEFRNGQFVYDKSLNDFNETEVVGNIYENLELLKEAK